MWILDVLPFLVGMCAYQYAQHRSGSIAGREFRGFFVLMTAITLIPMCMLVYTLQLNQRAEDMLSCVRLANSVRDAGGISSRNSLPAFVGPTITRLADMFPTESAELKQAWWSYKRGQSYNASTQEVASFVSASAARLAKHIEMLRSQHLLVASAHIKLGMLSLIAVLTMTLILSQRLSRAESRLSEQNEQLKNQRRDLERANLRLDRLASEDELTGLGNHRSLQEMLSHEQQLAVQTGSPLSVVMLDVDHFKKYNDVFGHLAGDAVLREVGGLLNSCTRKRDFAARYGGEEFVVVLPNTPATQAIEIADRIRHRIADHEWPQGRITISAGIATMDLGIYSANDLIQLADEALYAAKRRGRNRIEQNAKAVIRAAV
jgi:diguanylate cyclase (GGDEF)-like protein